MIRNILIVFISFCFLVSCQQKKSDPYNVLFIAVDDLNDYVSLLQDYPGIKTPNLDKLAEKGITFSRAYCAAPICNPSRTSLLTGMAPNISGIYSNNDHWTMSAQANEATVLPEAYKSAGYTTLWAGKLFHDLSAPSKERLEAMWDNTGTNVPGELWDGTTNIIPYGPTGPRGYGIIEPEAIFPDVANTKLAEAWLNQNHEKPFFMAVGIIRPHNPHTAPKKYFDMYPIDSIKLPPGYLESDLADVPQRGREIAGNWLQRAKEAGRWEEILQAYLACVSFADASIGRLVNALENSEYKDNTIIVLWGDHGFHMGEKNHYAKSTLWEQGTRNLLMFHVPGITNGGQVCNSPVSLLDIYPTLKELCNLKEIKQEFSGESLVHLLHHSEQSRKNPVLTTYPYKCHAIRKDNWRFIQYDDGTEELYNLEDDPYEWNNLAKDNNYASVLEELRGDLPEHNEHPVGPNPEQKKWREASKNIDTDYSFFGDPLKTKK